MRGRVRAARVGIDVDNVLRDFIGSVSVAFGEPRDSDWCREYNCIIERYFGGSREDFTRWMLEDAPWEKMPLEDDGVVAGLHAIVDAGHKVIINSATHSPEKAMRWFHNQGIFTLVSEWHWVQGSKKKYVLTDFLIDDNPSVISGVTKADAKTGHPRLVVVRDQPWNRHIEHPLRVENFMEFAEGVINLSEEN